MKLLFMLCALGMILASLRGQAQVTWNMGTGATANASPSSGLPVANLSVSTVTTGNNSVSSLLQSVSVSSGYTGASGSYNAAAIARTGAFSLTNSAYFELTLTPASGYQVTVSSISFGARSTKTGPARFSVRSNKDLYAGNLAGGGLVANNIWVRKALTNLGLTSATGTPLTIRIYGYDGIGNNPSSANWRIDDLSLGLSVNTPPGSCGGAPATATISSSEGTMLCSDNALTTLSLSSSYGSWSDIAFRWQQSTGTGFSDIPGANSPTYTTPDVITQNTDYRVLITCVTTNDVTTITPLTLSINPSPVLASSPTAQAACAGGSTSFSVSASGTGLSYSWYRLSNGIITQLSNGSNISGATSTSLGLSGLSGADAASYFAIVQSGAGCQKPTVDVPLMLTNPVAITQQPLSGSVRANAAYTFTVTATGDVTGYQWLKASVPIAGATSASYTISSVSTADTGTYAVQVQGSTACGNLASASAQLQLRSPLPLLLLGLDARRVNGGVQVIWTARETRQPAGYIVERSADGRYFAPVREFAGSAPGLGDSATWNDAGAPLSELYYRLRVEESDGIAAYSSVVKVPAATGGAGTIFVYPNPVRNRLTLRGGGRSRVSVFDLTGRIVWSGDTPDTGSPEMDLSQLLPGAYLLQACPMDKQECVRLPFVRLN